MGDGAIDIAIPTLIRIERPETGSQHQIIPWCFHSLDHVGLILVHRNAPKLGALGQESFKRLSEACSLVN